MAVNGPMARHVDDVRLGLEIMAGADWRDPGSVPVALSFADSGGPVRVALLPEPPGVTVQSGVAQIVRQAGAHLAAAGYQVDEVAPPEYEVVLELWTALLMTELRTLRPTLGQVVGADGLRFLDAGLDSGSALDVDAYVHLFVQRRRLARLWNEFFQTYPIILSPVWSRPAFPHSWDVENPAATLELMGPVKPANILGLPAAATPGGLLDGMPVGVQCIAAPFRDDRALDAAATIQAAVGMTAPVDPYVCAAQVDRTGRPIPS
jgi:amidase